MRAFGIAMTDTDTAIALGHPMDYDHPDVWNFVDKVSVKAKARGIYLTAGTGYADRTWDGIAARVRRLHDHGIDMIFFQSPEYLFQLATTELLAKVKGALKR